MKRDALLARFFALAVLALFLGPWFDVASSSTTGLELLCGSIRESLQGMRAGAARSGDFAAWSELSRVLFYRRMAVALIAIALGAAGLLVAPARAQRRLAALALGGMSCLFVYWTLAYALHETYELDGGTWSSVRVLFALDAASAIPLLLGALAALRGNECLARVLQLSLVVALVVPDHRGVSWAVRGAAVLLSLASHAIETRPFVSDEARDHEVQAEARPRPRKGTRRA